MSRKRAKITLIRAGRCHESSESYATTRMQGYISPLIPRVFKRMYSLS